MIVEYDKAGRITHLVFDPVPEGLANIMDKNGATFLDLPPIPLPDLPVLDESGNPRFETTYDQIFDEHNNAVLSEDGSPLVQVIETPVMQTGRFEYASVDINSDFVSEGAVHPRPGIDIPESIRLRVGETITVPGLPVPATVYVDRNQYVVEDGVLEIEGEMPAEYTIRFDTFPYLTADMKVTVYED